MARRRKLGEAHQQPSPYTKQYAYENLNPDVDFQIQGESSWFNFHSWTTNDAGLAWIDCYGGSGGQHPSVQFRSFFPERLKRDRKGDFVTRPSQKKVKADEAVEGK